VTSEAQVASASARMPIKLIATDLDGTLIGRDDDQEFYVPFRESINQFRRSRNAVWVVSTGRSLKSFRKAFLLMEHWDILPDFVIVRHAYIYSVFRGRYLPHFVWNARIRWQIRTHRNSIHRLLRLWHSQLFDRFDRMGTVVADPKRLCVQFSRIEDADTAAKFLQEKVRGHSLLNVFRYQSEVDVRVVPSTKGVALVQLCQRLGIGPEHCMAIGDGHNDLALLDPEVVKYVGCPANATSEIVSLVHERKGHIARGEAMEGVMEVLNAFETETVNSRLPEDFKSADDRENPISTTPARTPAGESRHARFERSKKVRSVIQASVCGYVALLVFAHFRIIPGSRFIELPFTIALKVVIRIAGLFD